MVDLGEGLAEGTVVDLVGEDTEEVEGSWPPRECPLPLRCRREDRSVGEREKRFTVFVCVCVRACVCVCVCARVLLILLPVNHYIILIHYSHSNFHFSEVGIGSRAYFLLLRP